jgi:death-on-curing family protein
MSFEHEARRARGISSSRSSGQPDRPSPAAQRLLALQRDAGNRAVAGALVSGQGRSRPADGPFNAGPVVIQRSWLGDRVDWVRTATAAGNWSQPDPPGAYYVLNGLSLDDMVGVLRALSPADRKKLADNLDEHGVGFDRSRLQLALSNAAAGPADAGFRERSEKLLWAIRSGNYANPDDGAFALLADVSDADRQRLLATLNRDALDALLAHRDAADAVTSGQQVVSMIEAKRAAIGLTTVETKLHDLLEGRALSQFFREFNGMNETDQMRFLRAANLVDISLIRDHIGAAEGIADQNHLRNLLEQAVHTASTSLYVDGFVQAYRWQPKYKVADSRDFSRIVGFGDQFDVEIDINTIDDAKLSDEEAARNQQEAKPGPGGLLWPAVLNRSTLPVLWMVKQDIRRQMETLLFDDVLKDGIFVVQYLLDVVFPIAHASAMQSLKALERASLSGRWMKGSQVVKGKAPTAEPAAKVPGGGAGPGSAPLAPRNAPEGGGFAQGMTADEISAVNRKMGGSVALTGDVSATLANASRRQGFWNKCAVIVRDIAGGHKFNDANKRTAQAVVEELMRRNGVSSGVSSTEMKKIILRVATGELREVEQIAKALRGF